MAKRRYGSVVVVIAVCMLSGCFSKNVPEGSITSFYEELEEASYGMLDSMFVICVNDELYYYGRDIYDIKEADLKDYEYITSVTEYVPDSRELKNNQMNFDAEGCNVYVYSDTEVLVCWPKAEESYQEAYQEDGNLNVWSGRKCVFARVE